jgi:hypothetical protein
VQSRFSPRKTKWFGFWSLEFSERQVAPFRAFFITDPAESVQDGMSDAESVADAATD